MGKYTEEKPAIKVVGKIELPPIKKPKKIYIAEVDSEIFKGSKDIYASGKNNKVILIRGQKDEIVGEKWLVGVVKQYAKFDLGVLIERLKTKKELEEDKLNNALKSLTNKFNGKSSKH